MKDGEIKRSLERGAVGAVLLNKGGWHSAPHMEMNAVWELDGETTWAIDMYSVQSREANDKIYIENVKVNTIYIKAADIIGISIKHRQVDAEERYRASHPDMARVPFEETDDGA